jgi:hypothetical protein
LTETGQNNFSNSNTLRFHGDLEHSSASIHFYRDGLITILGLALGNRKKKIYGWAIALTFGIYGVYDLVGNVGWAISDNILALVFFAATFSILFAVWAIYREASNRISGRTLFDCVCQEEM